jgi:hypothetical protein
VSSRTAILVTTARKAAAALAAVGMLALAGCAHSHSQAQGETGATSHLSSASAAAPSSPTAPQSGTTQTTPPSTDATAPPAGPSAPTVLTSCPTPGATATDTSGNQVDCTGSSGSALWVCDSSYPDPQNYPPVPGQLAPPAGWPYTVLDTDGTAYVESVNETAPGGGDGSPTPEYIWQLTTPPC